MLRAIGLGCGLYLLIALGFLANYPIQRSLAECALIISIGLLAIALGVGLSVSLVNNYRFSQSAEVIAKELPRNILPLGGTLSWLLLDLTSLGVYGPHPNIAWGLELFVSLVGGYLVTQLCCGALLGALVIAKMLSKSALGRLQSDRRTFEILAFAGTLVSVTCWWFYLFPPYW